MMNRKLIFVDDEVELLELYKDLFEEIDYEIFTESNPKKALPIIFDERIHVMFFDLKMPGLNGLELCQKIRKRNSIALIHAVTGHSSLFELAEVREAGFDDYFRKPVEAEKLLKAAQDAFEKLERWAKKK